MITKKTIKVLHVMRNNPETSIGGIETMVRHCFAFDGGFLNQKVLCYSSADNESHNSQTGGNFQVESIRPQIKIFNVPFSVIFYLRFFANYKRYDLINWHLPFPCLELLLIAGLIDGSKVVATYHADIVSKGFLGKIVNFLLSKALRSVFRIHVTSRSYLKTSLLLQHPEIKSRCIKIPLCVPDIKERYPMRCDSLNPGKLNLIFIGADRGYKGIQYLLDAVSGLRSVRLQLIGQIDQTQYEYDKNVSRFEGAYSEDEKYEALSQSDVLILPSISRAEAFGICLVEAAMMGVPAITTKLGSGNSEIVDDGVTGFVIPPRDSQILRKTIKLFIDDPELSRKLGKNARDKYTLNYTTEIFSTKLPNLYTQ